MPKTDQTNEKFESMLKVLGDFEKEARAYIEQVVDERVKTITEKEVKEIITGLLPDMDEMVSKKVKEHFVFLVQKLH